MLQMNRNSLFWQVPGLTWSEGEPGVKDLPDQGWLYQTMQNERGSLVSMEHTWFFLSRMARPLDGVMSYTCRPITGCQFNCASPTWCNQRADGSVKHRPCGYAKRDSRTAVPKIWPVFHSAGWKGNCFLSLFFSFLFFPLLSQGIGKSWWNYNGWDVEIWHKVAEEYIMDHQAVLNINQSSYGWFSTLYDFHSILKNKFTSLFSFPPRFGLSMQGGYVAGSHSKVKWGKPLPNSAHSQWSFWPFGTTCLLR